MSYKSEIQSKRQYYLPIMAALLFAYLERESCDNYCLPNGGPGSGDQIGPR